MSARLPTHLQVRDLFAEPPKRGQTAKSLDIRPGTETRVAGLLEKPVEAAHEIEALMTEGHKNRAVGSHDMNAQSSRSHSILCIRLTGTNLHNGDDIAGKLHLIDLAGSERVGKTNAGAQRLKEAQNINKSLSALGDVVSALAKKAKGRKDAHVPFRNSKLTYFLQDSLEGESKVLMFVNASPVLYNAR